MNIFGYLDAELANDNIPNYKRNRLLAIKYHLNGLSPPAISGALGISLRSVQRYIKEYTETGGESLVTKRSPGNKNALTPDQMHELARDLGQSPKDFNFAVPKWSPPTLSLHLESKYGVGLSLESCRLLLNEHLTGAARIKTKRIPTHKLKKDFDTSLNQLAQEPKNSIWILGQFYIGYRAAYKTKNKYNKKRAVIFCAKQYKGPNMILKFANPYRDKKEQWVELIHAVLAPSEQRNLYLFLPGSKENVYIASRFINESGKNLIIEFLPRWLPADLYLEDVKNDIIDKLNLPFKNTENKVLGKRKQEELKEYLKKLSTPNRA